MVATGVQARVSQHVGSGNQQAVAATVVHGLWGAAITYVILLAAACCGCFGLYASGLGIEPGTAAYAFGRDINNACHVTHHALNPHVLR